MKTEDGNHPFPGEPDDLGSSQRQGETQAPNQPTGQVTPNPSSVVHKFLVDVCSQSQPFRAMPSMLMSTMNFSFAQPAQ